MKFKKIDREYLLTDESVNVYGYRLLTSGYQLDVYRKNPIGYRMHKRDDGVVLRWEDFRIDGDKVWAKPVVNLSNPIGQQTADEMENGFMNAASVGRIVALEWSDEPSLKLEGQTGPTITKWYNKETSVCDIPGNDNALAELYDADEKALNLTDFIQSSLKKLPVSPLAGLSNNLNTDSMNFKERLIKTLPNLSDQSTDDEVTLALNDLVSRANKSDKLQLDLSAEKTARAKVEKDLSDLQDASSVKEVADLIDAGVTAMKINKAAGDKLKISFAGNPTGLKDLLDSMTAYQTVTGAIDGSVNKAQDLSAKSWSELDKEGKLEDLKAQDIDVFKAKFKAQFNKDYNG